MPKRAVTRFQPLQTCLVNLPLSIHGQLVAKAIRPQSLVVCLTWTSKDAGQQNQTAYVGWTGMPARTLGSPTAATSKNNVEAVELDPVAAKELGIQEGVEVSEGTNGQMY
jgi:peroxin-1